MENIPVSDLYYGICWVGSLVAIGLLTIGLFKATTIDLSEKGFYAMAFCLSMFAAITVQKNTRDQLQLQQNSMEKQPLQVPTKAVYKD